MTLPKTLVRNSALAILSASLMFTSACASYASKHEDQPTKTAELSSDIVDTAVKAGSFNTLVAAVQAAGLEETLRSEGPFTVFAPTDAAFAKLPDGTVDMLLEPDNRDKLVSILTYHVLEGAIESSAISGKTLEVTTVQGSTVSIDGTNGVTVDNANVVSADIQSSNGIIHVIDAVIMP